MNHLMSVKQMRAITRECERRARVEQIHVDYVGAHPDEYHAPEWEISEAKRRKAFHLRNALWYRNAAHFANYARDAVILTVGLEKIQYGHTLTA